MVNAMAQDEDGYMWFASLGGLNRFDGKQVRRFTHRPGDINSLRNEVPYSLAAGGDHKLWVGYIDGLQMFDSRSGKGMEIRAMVNRNISDITILPDHRILLLSGRKVFCYDPGRDKLVPLVAKADSETNILLNSPIFSFFLKDQVLLIGTEDGIIKLDLPSSKARILALPPGSGHIEQVGVDANGDIWGLNLKANKIWCIYHLTGKALSFDWLLQQPGDQRLATMLMMQATGQPEIWIGTRERGLIGYNTSSKQASYQQHDPERPQSLSADIIRQIYQAPGGTVWLNTMHGIDYFEPGKTLFERFRPYANAADPELGRGASEDRRGNLWLTSLRGISRYEPLTGRYTTWRNDSSNPATLYSNSVRASAEDELGRIWIATAAGINRLNPATGKMEFLTEADGLPTGFYFSINKDKRGRLWFGTRDNEGFYYYDPSDKKLHSLSGHASLQALSGSGGRYVMEDSRGRMWFGCNGQGLAMYDATNKIFRRWMYKGWLNDSSIANNLVIDIKEDRNGVVWVTSFGGISGIDLAKNKVQHFTDQNGLKSNIAGSLAVDENNRLWVGTSAGLLLIDSSRTRLTYFNEQDGLPVMEMPEHPGMQAANGDIIMPGIKGFIRFNPMQFTEQHALIPCYLSGITLLNSSGNSRIIEHPSPSLALKPQENFFTIALEAINFKNPLQTWYACKLEGFEKEWRYTQDAKAVYTNVPGGHYRFLYKASTDSTHWDSKEGVLKISVATVFYKTTWFGAMAALLASSLAYGWYRRKLSRQRQWMLLQGKAQALEKEKTLVMYESLKQQLNPHFLFNSLTSLEGLIESDQRLAGNFLAGMSKIYRYILQSNDSELVPIKDDLEMMKIYVRLQQTRFEKGLVVDLAVRTEDLQKKIPPVTLQNLVENAIKHNIIDEETPLRIRIFSDGEHLVISNNLQKKTRVETSNKQGLSSLMALYSYLTPKPVKMEESGETFSIWLPLI